MEAEGFEVRVLMADGTTITVQIGTNWYKLVQIVPCDRLS